MRTEGESLRDAMEPEMSPVAVAKRLLAFNTINPPGQERECARYLGSLLDDSGFQTTVVRRLVTGPVETAFDYENLGTVVVATIASAHSAYSFTSTWGCLTIRGKDG